MPVSKSISKSGGRRTKRKTKRKTNRKNNRKTRVKSYKGKTPMKKTLYYFYADYCGYCNRFNPLWETLKDKMKGNVPQVRVIKYR